MPKKSFEFQISLTAREYQNFYTGTVRHILVRDSHGATLQFPAALLQRFVTSAGVHGRFMLSCDEDHKNSDLKKIA